MAPAKRKAKAAAKYTGPQPRRYQWNGCDLDYKKSVTKKPFKQFLDKEPKVTDPVGQKRKPLTGKALFADLKTDYAATAAAPKAPALGAKQVWPAQPAGTTITDMAKVPPGWNYEEPDLKPE